MSLPLISPYQASFEGVENKVDWVVKAPRAALLVHDLQNHFVQAFEPGTHSQIATAIAHTKQLIAAAHRVGVPVYYTAQPPRQDPHDRALLTDFWGDGLQEDSAAEILTDVQPSPGDRVLTKWRYSAFARTALEEELRTEGRDQLLITGVYAHIGCLTTALEAFMRDIQPFLIADAMADFSKEEHEMACTYAAKRCAYVTATQRVLTQLQESPAAPLATELKGAA